MARQPLELLFVGIKDVVFALSPRDGSEVWRAKLRGGDFVTVLWDVAFALRDDRGVDVLNGNGN